MAVAGDEQGRTPGLPVVSHNRLGLLYDEFQGIGAPIIRLKITGISLYHLNSGLGSTILGYLPQPISNPFLDNN